MALHGYLPFANTVEIEKRQTSVEYLLPDGTYLTEIIDKRALNAKHFVLLHPNGQTENVAVFAARMHYEASPGQWENIDLDFRPDGVDNVADHNDVHVRVSGTWPGLDITERGSGRGIRWLTPARPAVATNRARFSDQGLDWEYTNTRTGAKLQAVVGASRGPQTYRFSYHLLGGAARLTAQPDGGLASDAFTVPRARAIGANGQTYLCGPWQALPGNVIAFDWNDTDLPAAGYPYTLDPSTTFNIAASGDDGRAGSDVVGSYPPPAYDADTTLQAPAAERNFSAGPYYTVRVLLMRWDTSSLPDNAVVSAATLRAYIVGKGDADGRSFAVEWYSSANWPIDTGDYTATAANDAHSGTTIASIATSADNDFALANLTNINLTGYTGMRCHITGGQPSVGYNYVTMAHYDHTTETEPRLLVTYAVPSGYHMII